jgi:hypothetical protein
MELIANLVQTVDQGGNILFTDEAVSGCNSILHRSGSGQATLRGITSQCRARFRVFFSGNIAIPTGGTVEAISLAIAINGEAVASTTMIQTPAAVAEFSNVASAVFIDVPAGCCITVSVKNISEQAIDVQNANLIIERVA